MAKPKGSSGKSVNQNQIKTGSPQFIEELKKRTFFSSEDIYTFENGKDLTWSFLEDSEFAFPIIVKQPEGLGIKVPPFKDLTEIEQHIGPKLIVELVDVGKQEHVEMSFSNFVKYMLMKKRNRILNMISCECSKLSLGQFIEPPELARKIDWAFKFWDTPKDGYTPEESTSVQKYCLISSKDSYTDFHVDFSGTSVWYHIVKGQKVFYIIMPTEDNLKLFWNWSQSRNRTVTFFADLVDKCYRCTLTENMTLFLPSGWIHAVLTEEDSLVYGGNYLHSFNIGRQIEIYEMEMKQKIPYQQRYPNFRDLNWFAARGLCTELKKLLDLGVTPPLYLVNGLKALLAALKMWLRKSPVSRYSYHNPKVLFKDLSKEIRRADRFLLSKNPPKPERGSTRVRRKPAYDDYVLEFTSEAKKARLAKRETILTKQSTIGLVETNLTKTVTVETSESVVNNVINEESRCDTNSEISHELTGYGNWKRVKTSTGSTGLKVVLSKLPTSSLPTSYSRLKDESIYDFVEEELSLSKKTQELPSTSQCILQTDADIESHLLQDEAAAHNLPKQRVIGSRESNDLDSANSPETSRHVPSSEDELSFNVHDDDYIYLSLEESSEDDTGSTQGDKAWNPRSKVTICPKQDRPLRQGTQKKSYGKVLKAAAAKVVIHNSSPEQELVAPEIPPKIVENNVTNKAPKTVAQPTIHRNVQSASSSTASVSRPKKKLHTVKQRLSKILKLHRMRH